MNILLEQALRSWRACLSDPANLGQLLGHGHGAGSETLADKLQNNVGEVGLEQDRWQA
jgi:hypothetical protein